MEFIKKVTTTGTSLCVVIDKLIANSLSIEKGDLIKIKIKKWKRGD